MNHVGYLVRCVAQVCQLWYLKWAADAAGEADWPLMAKCLCQSLVWVVVWLPVMLTVDSAYTKKDERVDP